MHAHTKKKVEIYRSSMCYNNNNNNNNNTKKYSTTLAAHMLDGFYFTGALIQSISI